MATIHIPVPDGLQSFIDEQVVDHGFDTGAAYILDLVQREKLRAMILEGANSPIACVADEAYFEGLRRIARGEE